MKEKKENDDETLTGVGMEVVLDLSFPFFEPSPNIVD